MGSPSIVGLNDSRSIRDIALHLHFSAFLHFYQLDAPDITTMTKHDGPVGCELDDKTEQMYNEVKGLRLWVSFQRRIGLNRKIQDDHFSL